MRLKVYFHVANDTDEGGPRNEDAEILKIRRQQQQKLETEGNVVQECL